MSFAPIRRPHIHELETFLLAARHGSLARAAEDLRITKTAAAKRVSMLETLAGERLLERGPRGTELTAAGRKLLPEVEQLLRECDRIFDRLRELRNGYDPTRISGLRTLLQPRSVSTERLLSETERFLATLFHTVSDGIAVIEPESGTLVELNDALARMLGQAREQLLGRSAEAFGLPSSVTEATEWKLIAVSGARRHVELTVTRISLGAAPRLLAVVRDGCAVSATAA